MSGIRAPLAAPGGWEAPGPDETNPLGPAFSGSPATTGIRLIAFTIDAVLVLGIGGVVLATTSSLTLAVVVSVQLAVGLAVALARTGATPGNLLLRLRASRSDAPFSPGAGRAFVRALITGTGFIVGVGAWIVVASSAWDKRGRRQSWADRAAETVVVAVPRRGAADGRARTAALTPPQLISMSARPAVDEDDEPAADVAGFSPDSLPSAPPTGLPPVPPGPLPALITQAPPSAPPAPVRGATPGAALLLVFDTGQRVRIDVPAAVILGRRPAPTEPGDLLIMVDDPDSTVSKSHLRLENSRGRTWVTDLGSTNGSDILADQGGRTELLPGVRSLLDDGDRVRVGDRVFSINSLLPHTERNGAA